MSRALRSILAAAVLAIAGGFFGHTASALLLGDSRLDLAAGEVLALLALLPLSAFLAIAWHELGHVAAGVANGMRFAVFAAGPLWVERTGEGLQLKFNRLVATWGGISLCIPTDADRIERRMAWLLAGGPLASLALALVALTPLGFKALDELSVPGLAAMATGVISFAVFVATALMPGFGLGAGTDGQRLRRIWRGGPGARADAAIFALTGLALTGRDPADWPEPLVEAMAAAEGPFAENAALCLLATRDFECGERASALEALEASTTHWDDLPKVVATVTAPDLALLTALVRRDAGAARAWLDRAEGPLVAAHTRALAEAAIADIEGRPDDCAAALLRASAAIPRAIVPATAGQQALLEELRPAS